MPITIGDGLSFCGHALTEAELAMIRGITREFANLAWTELAATICELLQWRRPNGGLKSRECYLFLRELHRRGWLPWLTAPPLRARRTPLAKLTTDQAPSYNLLPGPLDPYRPIHLQLIEDAAQRRLFREYLDRYHYLGDPARQSNLPLIGNHSRFLILPWAQIPNLASHILACAARQLPGDWLAHYGVEPVLLETLVDPARYRGICYRAANWIEVGMTQGRGRMDGSRRAQGIPKQIFLYPLHRHCRQRLCIPSPAELP